MACRCGGDDLVAGSGSALDVPAGGFAGVVVVGADAAAVVGAGEGVEADGQRDLDRDRRRGGLAGQAFDHGVAAGSQTTTARSFIKQTIRSSTDTIG